MVRDIEEGAMNWQAACQLSEDHEASRTYPCQCSKHCDGVTFIRKHNGDTVRLHRGQFGPARAEEIEGYDDWEPFGVVIKERAQ